MQNMMEMIECSRADAHAKIDTTFDALLASLTGGSDESVAPSLKFKAPTLSDGHDSRNKNGVNLTPRGVEILYRVFDDDGGYNRAAKMLNISQGAAKHRKGGWVRDGGKERQKLVLDIDLT